MPTFNSAQLTAFLNAVSEPAQLYDVRGNMVAENALARTVEWPDHEGAGNEDTQNVIDTVDLGEGWFLRRMALLTLSGAPVRLSGPGAARPNMQALMSGITHELRNPLAAILTAVTLLNDDQKIDEETAMLLGVVRDEAKRMAAILTEFSLYVKSPPPQPESFDFIETARKSLHELRDKGEWNEHIKIDNRLPESLMVYADPLQMQQVLMRLLENALHAVGANPAGVIRLISYAQADTQRVVICVEDNGPGFGDEEKQRAFIPFYSTKPQATGLGLPIAQTTLQAAGGAIWLENRSSPTTTNNSSTVNSANSKAANSKAANTNTSIVTETSEDISSGARVCFALPGSPAEI